MHIHFDVSTVGPNACVCHEETHATDGSSHTYAGLSSLISIEWIASRPLPQGGTKSRT